MSREREYVAQVCATPKGPCVTARHRNPLVAWGIALSIGLLGLKVMGLLGGRR